MLGVLRQRCMSQAEAGSQKEDVTDDERARAIGLRSRLYHCLLYSWDGNLGDRLQGRTGRRVLEQSIEKRGD